MGKTYFESKKGSVEDKINTIAKEQSTISASYKPDVKLSVEKKYFESKKGSIEEIASKIVSEGLDKVNPDAVKKKFDDRKDKDIDNDGDTDSTDKYLHKRRAAISKAMKEDLGKEDEPKVQKIIGKLKKASDAHAGQAKDLEKAMKEAISQDDHGEKINQDKKDAAMKKTDAKKTFKELRQVKLGDKGKTATGKDAGVIELEPQARPIKGQSHGDHILRHGWCSSRF